MFCADYVAAFVAHALATVGVASLTRRATTAKAQNTPAAATARESTASPLVAGVLGLGRNDVVLPFAWGGLAGLAGACAVFPFDFVRAGVAPAGTSTAALFRGSLSTVPYSAVFFGVYFSGRRAHDDGPGARAAWALAAGALAVAAEAPFDRAKRALFGSRAVQLGANALFVPFAAVLLVLYDGALVRSFGGGGGRERKSKGGF